MDAIINNLGYIVAIIVIVLIVIYGVMTGKVKEWLRYAVTMAEKELGTGTGQLKLREVYDWFIDQFPVFSKLLPFPIFSKLVDDALDWMRDQMECNEKINEYVSCNCEENNNV